MFKYMYIYIYIYVYACVYIYVYVSIYEENWIPSPQSCVQIHPKRSIIGYS